MDVDVAGPQILDRGGADLVVVESGRHREATSALHVPFNVLNVRCRRLRERQRAPTPSLGDVLWRRTRHNRVTAFIS